MWEEAEIPRTHKHKEKRWYSAYNAFEIIFFWLCTSLQMFHIVHESSEQRSNCNQLRNIKPKQNERAKSRQDKRRHRWGTSVMEFIMCAKDSAQYHVDTLIYTTALGDKPVIPFQLWSTAVTSGAAWSYDLVRWCGGAMMLPPCRRTHKCYSSLMAQRHLLSGSVWDWAGDIAVHGLFISLLLTGEGTRLERAKKKNSVSVSKSVKCDRDLSVLNMRQSLKSNSQLDGDPPVREEHLFLICPRIDEWHTAATERGGWQRWKEKPSVSCVHIHNRLLP